MWNAGAAYGEARLDCDGPVEGCAVAIEVKRFDGKGTLTTRQKVDMRAYRAAGAHVFLIDDEASMQKFFAWCEEAMKSREWREAMNKAITTTHYAD